MGAPARDCPHRRCNEDRDHRRREGFRVAAQTFGYSSGGPLFTVGFKFIPAAFGNWLLKAGVQFLVLNSNLQTVNTGDSFVPIGSVGMAMTY